MKCSWVISCVTELVFNVSETLSVSTCRGWCDVCCFCTQYLHRKLLSVPPKTASEMLFNSTLTQLITQEYFSAHCHHESFKYLTWALCQFCFPYLVLGLRSDQNTTTGINYDCSEWCAHNSDAQQFEWMVTCQRQTTVPMNSTIMEICKKTHTSWKLGFTVHKQKKHL